MATKVHITYVEPDGARREFEIPEGWNVMDGAITHDVKGVIARCGGACDCATCHVYVDEKFLPLIPAPMREEEAALVVVASPRKPNSRLACQIPVRPELDGLVVYVAERQL